MKSGMIYKPGDEIAVRYQVEDYIGAGGMQEVYRALDTVLHRRVALKVPKNSSAERRFRRSAVLSARVNHPNAAKTLDYVDDKARPHLVEELVDGTDLHRIRDELFPLMDPYLTAHLMHHIVKGLAASHHVGVVHRDLKPSNIMVSLGLNFETVKITDFGIAKMAEDEMADAVEGGSDTITSSHTMMGALPYLAPEMIKNPREADKPADVWSVGAMTFEFLTGEKPFGKNLIAVERIRKDPPPPLPAFISGTRQFYELASEVYQLILRCLQKDSAARPTADELVGLCGQLCYPVIRRREGLVKNLFFDKNWGFISVEGPDVFFNTDSVYGPLPSVGDRVCFAEFPGEPRARAHPVLVMRPTAATS